MMPLLLAKNDSRWLVSHSGFSRSNFHIRFFDIRHAFSIGRRTRESTNGRKEHVTKAHYTDVGGR